MLARIARKVGSRNRSRRTGCNAAAITGNCTPSDQLASSAELATRNRI